MLDFCIKVTTRFKFWDRLVMWAFIVCIVSIAVRQGFKPDLSADVRFYLKQIHIYSGLTTAVAAFFHGIGHSGVLVKLKNKKKSAG